LVNVDTHKEDNIEDQVEGKVEDDVVEDKVEDKIEYNALEDDTEHKVEDKVEDKVEEDGESRTEDEIKAHDEEKIELIDEDKKTEDKKEEEPLLASDEVNTEEKGLDGEGPAPFSFTIPAFEDVDTFKEKKKTSLFDDDDAGLGTPTLTSPFGSSPNNGRESNTTKTTEGGKKAALFDSDFDYFGGDSPKKQPPAAVSALFAEPSGAFADFEAGADFSAPIASGLPKEKTTASAATKAKAKSLLFGNEEEKDPLGGADSFFNF